LGRLFAAKQDEGLHGTPSRILEQLTAHDIDPRKAIKKRLNDLEAKAKVIRETTTTTDTNIAVKPIHQFSIGYLIH
jgi:hypothetical protein